MAAELARALVVTRSGKRPDDIDRRLNDAAAQVRVSVQPLLQTLNLDQRSAVWGAARSASDDALVDEALADDGLDDEAATDQAATDAAAADRSAADKP